jgi:hypothetical protein
VERATLYAADEPRPDPIGISLEIYILIKPPVDASAIPRSLMINSISFCSFSFSTYCSRVL